MRRKILVILGAMLLCSSIVLAADKKDNKANEQAALQTAQQEKDLLIANINNMRTQELRVAILQQILNEEIAKLRNVQAVFCDQYKLDVDKFRKGLYRYDENKGKFVEIDASSSKR